MRSEQGYRAPLISNSRSSTQQRLGQRSKPATTSNKRGGHYHGAPPGAATGQPPCASLTDSDLLTPSGKAPNTRGIFTTQNRWGLTQTCYFPAVQDWVPPADPDQTTSNTDPDKARRAQTHCASRKARSDQQHTDPEPHSNDNTPQIHRVPSQDTHTKPPASTDRDTASRPLGSGDQTDLSTKAATRPTVWGHYPHEPRPS